MKALRSRPRRNRQVRRPEIIAETPWIVAASRRVALTNAAIMKHKGINKGEIAAILGFNSQSTLSNWESVENTNLPGGREAYLYHYHFKVTADWLYLGDPSNLPVALWGVIDALRKSKP